MASFFQQLLSLCLEELLDDFCEDESAFRFWPRLDLDHVQIMGYQTGLWFDDFIAVFVYVGSGLYPEARRLVRARVVPFRRSDEGYRDVAAACGAPSTGPSERTTVLWRDPGRS